MSNLFVGFAVTPRRPARPFEIRFAAGTILLAISMAGCEVPQPPAEQAEAAPPQPTYANPDSDAGQRVAQAKVQQTQEKTAGPAGSTATDGGNGFSDLVSSPDTPSGGDAGTSGKVVAAAPGAGKWKPYQPGIITTSINAYFSTRQRMAFNQIVHGLKTFRAQHGRKPKDFGEVLKEIIEPAALILPELEPGDQYVYMPDKGPDGEIGVLKKGQ